MLIKYYPYLAKQLLVLDWRTAVRGSATSKNMLGVVCLISGIFLFLGYGDTLVWSQGTAHEMELIRELRLHWHDAMAAESLPQRNFPCVPRDWLFVVVAVHSGWGRRHPTFLKVHSSGELSACT